MWSDNETNEDLLGFSIHANLLASIITNPKMLPVTVGLFGDWGGGKSSILKMLKENLDNRDDFAVIYFNSWVFEGYEDAKCAILKTLLNELRDHRNLKNIIGDEITALLKSVDVMKLVKTGVSAGLAYASANPLPLLMAVGALLQGKKPEYDGAKSEKKLDFDLKFEDLFRKTQESVQDIRSFRASFQKTIEKTNLKAVIILIDDLDRCSPERLIDNLEAIKLFLNVSHTAFVVATDRRIVENAIRTRYSDLFTREDDTSRREVLVTDYLEKFIQVPYTLPKLAPHEIRSYLNMLFLKKYLPADSFNNVLKKYTQFLNKERYASFQVGDEITLIEDDTIRSVVTESLRLVEVCSDAITDGLKGNPRQVKRFLNAFWLRKELAKAANLTHLKDHILIKLMVLEYISNERFEDLYQWHRLSPDGRAKQLEELEVAESVEEISKKNVSWSTSRLWRWIKAEPRLKSEDLRDYFWISRSSIADTLAGVRLITQTMRICAEELLSKLATERQNGISMFMSLSEDEQGGVLGVIRRHALQAPKEEAPFLSLLDLASKGYLNAADTFGLCVEQIDVKEFAPGLGITLRAFKTEKNNRATEMIAKIREKLSKTDSTVGRALQAQQKGKH